LPDILERTPISKGHSKRFRRSNDGEPSRHEDRKAWTAASTRPSPSFLATPVEDNEPRPLFWTVEHAKGRMFVSIPGHYSWTFDDPLFRVLLLRGIAWAAREPFDRFNALVWPGADACFSTKAD
jgi:type 1 glutamine amidotransferase